MNILIIGFGTAGKHYFDLLKKSKNINKIYILDDLKQPINKNYIQISKNEIYNKSLKIKYAFICTPSDLHYIYAKICLNLSINVLIEKPFVLDLDEETDFFKDLFSLKLAISEDLFGEHVEKMVGLPKGGGLRLNLLEGDETDRYGRVELVSYVGAGKQNNLYEIANPPALGTLHCLFKVETISEIKKKLQKRSINFDEFGSLDLIYGKGEVISFRSPAGLRIDVQELQSKNP